MKKIKICTPVVGKDLKEFLKNLDKVQAVSEMVELRVDKIKDLTENDLKLIRKKTVKESIFTSRNKETILEGLNLGFDYIDIEFSLLSQLNLSQNNKHKVILSFHDYEKTSSLKELTEKVDNMRKFGVGVVKIATMVKNDTDMDNLFRILISKKKNEKIIVVGMGKKGRLTRILGPLLGSFLTFTSTQYGKSALGQVDIIKLKKIYKLVDSGYELPTTNY